MKIKPIHALLTALCLNIATAKDAPASFPKSWNSDSRAVYKLLVAQFQHADADYSGSVDTLVTFAKKQKDDRLYSKALKALLETERYSDAVALAEDWKKHSELTVSPFYVLALALNNDIDAGVEEINQALEKKKTDGEEETTAILGPYIQMLISHWYNPKVTEVLGKLYEQHPDNILLFSTYTQQLRWQGDIDQAVALIDKRLFDDPKNLALRQEKSDIYRYTVQPEKAEQVWKNLLADYPNDDLFRFAYAQFLYDSYNFAGAETQLARIHNSDLARSVELLKMMSLVQQEKYDDAAAVFDDNLAKDEDHDRARYTLVVQLLQKNAYELAEKYVRRLADFDNDSDNEWSLPAALQLGRILYATAKGDDLSQGDAWFEKVQEHFHLDREEALQEQTNALQKAGRERIAYERLSAFLKANPNHEELRYTRGLLAAEMQLMQPAIEDLKIIHAASPDNLDVQNALGYTLLSERKEIPEAEKLIQKALFSKPTSPAVTDSMGWLHYQRGEYDASLPYFRFSYAHYLDGEIIGHYILALYHRGDVATAKKLYQLEIQYPENVTKINRQVEPILSKLKD